jgi:hypothetical protein
MRVTGTPTDRSATSTGTWRRRAGAVAASVALMAVPAATIGAATAAADPGPECSGQPGNCWEYQNWYWTYDNCNEAGRDKVGGSAGRYDDYNCAGGHGAVVWLWAHKR